MANVAWGLAKLGLLHEELFQVRSEATSGVFWGIRSDGLAGYWAIGVDVWSIKRQ